MKTSAVTFVLFSFSIFSAVHGLAARDPTRVEARHVPGGIQARAPASTGTVVDTMPCHQDSDCASGCCGFNTGICAGPVVALQNADGGCGHGNAKPNADAAAAAGFLPQANEFTMTASGMIAVVTASSTSPSKPNAPAPAQPSGTKFITEPCGSDSECSLGCCAFLSGKCAGPVVAQQLATDGGCGHGNASPNNNAAMALLGPNAPAASGVMNSVTG